ncbi:hypothetical protein AAC387_Pa03g4560 [Persea americana]
MFAVTIHLIRLMFGLFNNHERRVGSISLPCGSGRCAATWCGIASSSGLWLVSLLKLPNVDGILESYCSSILVEAGSFCSLSLVIYGAYDLHCTLYL